MALIFRVLSSILLVALSGVAFANSPRGPIYEPAFDPSSPSLEEVATITLKETDPLTEASMKGFAKAIMNPVYSLNVNEKLNFYYYSNSSDLDGICIREGRGNGALKQAGFVTSFMAGDQDASQVITVDEAGQILTTDGSYKMNPDSSEVLVEDRWRIVFLYCRAN